MGHGLVTHSPVFKDYLYEGLRQFYLDNVMYVEIRALLPLVCLFPLFSQLLIQENLLKHLTFGATQTYELDGRQNTREWSLRACQEVLRCFRAQYPDFLGARIIFSARRLESFTFHNLCVCVRILELFKG